MYSRAQFCLCYYTSESFPQRSRNNDKASSCICGETMTILPWYKAHTQRLHDGKISCAARILRDRVSNSRTRRACAEIIDTFPAVSPIVNLRALPRFHGVAPCFRQADREYLAACIWNALRCLWTYVDRTEAGDRNVWQLAYK